MTRRAAELAAAAVCLAVLVLVSGCTVHQTDTPPLMGPSEFGLSVGITTTPDSITQDGVSQSEVVVVAHDPNGNPKSGVTIRLDMEVNGVLQDFGRLSSKSIVTSANGRATATYTAPAAPPAGTVGGGTIMTIRATPTGSNFQAAISQSSDIRLVPPGVILPPAGTPTPDFTFSPTSPTANAAVQFDASASLAGLNGQIVSFSWSFGDATSATGKTTSHTFTSSGTFQVTLTVTNDRGLAASKTVAVAIGSGAGPTADFIFSPVAPVPLQEIFFDASASKPGNGHSIVSYGWNFGDGETKSGVTVTHDFVVAGTYNVILTVTDEAGQKTTATKPVTVAAGTTSGPIFADFIFSPTNPTISKGTNTVFFDATSSSPAATTWTWDFGDGSAAGSGQKPSHTFALTGTWVVRLTITDAAGHSATTTKTVSVSP